MNVLMTAASDESSEELDGSVIRKTLQTDLAREKQKEVFYTTENNVGSSKDLKTAELHALKRAFYMEDPTQNNHRHL